VDIYPDFGAFGDNTTIQTVIGALLTFVLVTAVLTMLISPALPGRSARAGKRSDLVAYLPGITWAIATAHGNHTTATKAHTGLLAALEQAAIQANCEPRLLAGQQVKTFTTAALPLCRQV